MSATLRESRQSRARRLLAGGPAANERYRFVRYYTREASYRTKGPPQLGLRLLARSSSPPPQSCSRAASR